jgi:phosphatidylglycerophosphatase A
VSAANCSTWGNGSGKGIDSLQEPYGEIKTKQSEPNRLAYWAASVIGLGHAPLVPGTVASLVTVCAVGLVHQHIPYGRIGLACFLALLVPVSIVSSGHVARRGGSQDPSHIVIDEVVGQILSLLWVPISLTSLIIGFIAFRIFDILKPFPVGWSERLPGGLGIVCDDLLAGVYAGLVTLAITQYLIGG